MSAFWLVLDHLRRRVLRGLSVPVLFARFRETRDEEAIAELVTRTTPRLRARCRAYLQDSDEIDDVVQEVFRLLLKQGDAIRDGNAVERWLDRTAENVARNRSRRQARRTPRPLPPEELETTDPTPGPELLLELREKYAEVLVEIDRLNEDWRRALTLRLLEERPYAEVARILGASLDKVKQDVSRARKQLRSRLVRKGIVLPAVLAGALFGSTMAGAWTGSTAAARSLARKWVVWAGLAAAGLGTLLLLRGAAPGAPEGVVPAPTAPVAVMETLQAKNLRIFHEEVEPRITRALGQIGGGEVRLVDVKAEGSEVICLLEGSRPFPGSSKPPRVRGRYCVLARVLDSELDLFGTGDWKPANAEKIVLRPELFGKPLAEVSISIEHLGLHDAFALLPPDERALEAINAQIGREPAAEFALPPAPWWCVGGNSRYLYVATRGLLLARDGRGDDTRWRCVGTVPRNGGKLAANDGSLFWVRTDGRIFTRPAEPSAHEWRPLGSEHPGGGPLCASRDTLWCAGEDGVLWSRPLEPQAAAWRKGGSVPGGRELAVAGERLYCLSTRDGKRELWSRPLAGETESWQPAGDYPALKPDSSWIDWNLEVWGEQFLAWSTFDDRVFARPAGPEPQPWRQVGKKDVDFLRRW